MNTINTTTQEHKLYVAESVYLDDSRVRAFQEPFLDYSESEYGRYHFKQKLRFGPYSYDTMQMYADLGADVHPLLHMPFTHTQVVQPMLRKQIASGQHGNLSAESIRLLRQAAYFHDTGENEHPALLEACGGTVGDLDWPTKNGQTLEQKKKIRAFFYKEHLKHMSDDELMALDAIIADDSPRTYEKEFFDTAEHLGYLSTAMKAGEIALAHIHELKSEPSHRLRQLGRMAFVVGNRRYADLGKTSNDYPYVKAKLEKYAAILSAVNTQVKPNIEKVIGQ